MTTLKLRRKKPIRKLVGEPYKDKYLTTTFLQAIHYPDSDPNQYLNTTQILIKILQIRNSKAWVHRNKIKK